MTTLAVKPATDIAPVAPLRTSRFTGTGQLVRAALRRDRVLLPVWVVVLASMVLVSAVAIVDLYPTEADRISASQVINLSPALVALYGPIINESSLGELAMSKMTVMYAAIVMGMVLVLVRRHTRTEEETGRAELVGATLVGRAAPLQAALVEGAIASVLVGLLGVLSNIVCGLDVSGSIAFGASWTGIGLVGTGLAALCCQLSPSTRTCGGITLAAIAVIFVVRAAGDTGPWVLGWFSPLGWGTRLHAWGDTRWWVLGLYPATAVVLAGAAHLLRTRRDVGSAVLAERAGPRDGRVGSMPGLVWRLNRLSIAWWAVATVAFGVLFGSIAPHLDGLFDSPAGKAALEAMGGTGKVQEVMLSALLAIMAALLTAFSLQLVSQAGHEETEGRTGVVLAAQGSRARAYLSVVGAALIGPVVLALAYGLGSALGFGTQVNGVWPTLRNLVPAALAHVPAMWVVAALAVLAWTMRPTLAWVGWALWGAFITVGELGPLLKLPDWAINLSPYQHVVNVPVEPVNWGGELALVVVTLGVLVIGWARYRSRDLA